MFNILLLLSYTNLSNIPVNLYYREELSKSSTLSDNFIITTYYYDGHLLYAEPEKTIDNLSDEAFRDNFRTLLTKEIRKSSEEASKTRAREGFIQDIDLDLNMPRGLTNIIGEGGHLSINGKQDIDLEVERTKHTYAYYEASPAFPQIKLDTRLDANIKGTIGTKVHVQIDHNSERPEQDNDLKIWYGSSGMGTDPEVEDDIIQSLHLGKIEGLGGEKTFGIATRGKMGSTSFDLSAGKLETYEGEGSGSIELSTSTTTIFDKDYLKNQYFYTGLPHPSSDSLISYGLFQNFGSTQDGTIKKHKLFSFKENSFINAFPFNELIEEEDYEFREFIYEDKKIPYFYIKNSYLLNGKYLGVYLIYADSTGNIDTIGNLTGDTLELYALKLSNPIPSDTSWYMQMRNVYSIGTTEPSDIMIEINKIVVGENNQSTGSGDSLFVNILGISNNDQGRPKPGLIIWEHGHIVFPDRFPFLNPRLGADTVAEIYREQPPQTGEFGEEYEIIISTSASSSSQSFTLEGRRGFIIEKSEQLVADGKTLKRDEDYTINYQTGEVTIKKEAALAPDAKITYTFKSQPFFSFDSQYKAKANIQSQPFEDSKLDFNMNFLSRSDKGVFHPTVGKEPSNITTGSINFSLNKEPEFLSQFFSNLPLVDKDSKSRINIDGIYGFSLPNPATNGKSYLDDMESIDLSYNLELLERAWYNSSRPDNSVSIGNLGKLDWFTNERYSKSRIFSEYASATYEENRTRVLILNFQPNTSIADPEESWGGIMKTFSSEQDFSQKNFLEIWVLADEGELIFDMGDKMDEDIPRLGIDPTGNYLTIISPNGILDLEDKNSDGLLQTGEDTGLDGIRWDDGNWEYNSDSLDDGIDDYYAARGSYTDSLRRHNKEGNGKLDSEDLNHDYALERNNSFFRYRIDLSSQEYLEKEGLNGWKVFKIPLSDSLAYEETGNPSLKNIEYTRIWLRGLDEETKITIAKVGLVGNKWQNKGVRFASNDSLNPTGGSFEVGQRNTREDDDYVAPVEREKNIMSNTYLKEQSLALKIDSLETGNYCVVENYLELPIENSANGYDFRLYKTLNFYAKYIGTEIDSTRIFLRFLKDTANYYQFSTTLREEDDWDTLEVVFENFTDLKVNNDTIRGNYSLKGNPSLKNVVFVQLGVINPYSETMTGEVLFDDIIFKNVDNRRGNDASLSISTNVGDLITGISYKINKQNANYKGSLDALRTLGDKEISSQTFRITANAGKFLNRIVDCPITYSTTQSEKTPVYRINSDVPLPLEEADSLTDKGYSKNITINISRNSTSDPWLLKNTLGNLQLSGSYRLGDNFNPFKSTDTTKSSTASANYNLQLPTLSLPVIGGGSSSLLPTNIRLKTTYEYSTTNRYNYKDSTYEKSISPVKKDLTNSGNINYKPIRWIELNYSITTKNDLRERESFSEDNSLSNLGQDASLNEDFSASHSSDILGINNLRITYKSSFKQDHSIDYSKSLGDSLDVRQCNQNRNIAINDDFKLNSLLEKVPVISKVSKSISPVKLSANFNKTGTFAYLNSKPDYRFRYGLETTPDSNLFASTKNTDGGYLSKIYSASSGITTSRIDVRIQAKLTEKVPDELLLQSTTIAKKDVSLTFPDIDINVPNIQKYIPFLSNFVRRTNLSISIQRDTSYTQGLNKEFSEGSSSLMVSPGFNLDMKNGLRFNIIPQYNTGKNYPSNMPEINYQTKSLSVQCTYTLNPSPSGLSIPLFGNIKWDKPINLNASFQYRDNVRYGIGSNGDKNYSEDTKTIDVSLGGNYTFSDMISGGLSINYRNFVNRRLENMTSTSFGGKFNVSIQF
jgi:hypothetical protein